MMRKSCLFQSKKLCSLLNFLLIVVFSHFADTLASQATAEVFRVGPGKKYSSIGEVPLDLLNPGDIVEIYYRPEPYHEKFIIRRSGTKERPIVVKGVPHRRKLPVIDGRNARQIQKENWAPAGRWLIKVGDGTPGDHVQIRNFKLRNANNMERYYIPNHKREYQDNAAGIFVRFGRNVLILGCAISSCGNGIQTSYAPDVSHLTVSRCLIYDNGNHKNLESSQEHNVYLCGTHTTVQGCRFGEPHSDGNNIKDRGVETIIRYNWIQGGKNRQLDLVDHEGYQQANAIVYGNVIIQGNIVHNNNMIHWGGDQGISRSAKLHFFNNTVIGRAKKTRFIHVRYRDCSVELKNNLFLGSGTLWTGKGSVDGSNNWSSTNISLPRSLILGLIGISPGLMADSTMQYMPGPGSGLVNAGTNAVPRAVRFMPKQWTGAIRRPQDGRLDIGAFEAQRGSGGR